MGGQAHPSWMCTLPAVCWSRPRVRSCRRITGASRRRCLAVALAAASAAVTGPHKSPGRHVVVAGLMLRRRARQRLWGCRGLVESLGHSRRRCRPVRTRVRPPPVESHCTHVVAAVPVLRYRCRPRLRGCLHMVATSSLPPRCSGIGRGRGCGAANARRITGLSRHRRRPDAPASASAAVAGLPSSSPS